MKFFNVNFQTKQTNAKRIALNEKNEMKGNLQTLHIKRKIWKGHNRNLICWAFYCVNDDRKIDLGNPQAMRCLFCYNSCMRAFNPNTKNKK
jgi:hypothetical protein